eukprot:MONOS_1117.1-p1 / transcript=MONOS_1117.1 / gene=MONOS_1117 / organism=Monocercomonoides_exilis_PA203 / gene_product=unspecified product / transcript_product=unspecified product / location=Mono_scaffold00019:17779-18420(+) / protein_length=214 / sequence_SO=supercontig / SO=protein_coding / is_pseudo=false
MPCGCSFCINASKENSSVVSGYSFNFTYQPNETYAHGRINTTNIIDSNTTSLRVYLVYPFTNTMSFASKDFVVNITNIPPKPTPYPEKDPSETYSDEHALDFVFILIYVFMAVVPCIAFSIIAVIVCRVVRNEYRRRNANLHSKSEYYQTPVTNQQQTLLYPPNNSYIHANNNIPITPMPVYSIPITLPNPIVIDNRHASTAQNYQTVAYSVP